MKTVDLGIIADFIDRLLDTPSQPDREGNGLALRAKETVSKIGAALNTSFESIQRAEELGVDLLLVHHTSWESIDLHLKQDKFARLERAGISLYAAHEALDHAPEFGAAGILAAFLGLEIGGRYAEGGVYGRVSFASFDALVARIEDILRAPVEHWQNNAECRKVAILPGGAGLTPYLQQALELGCDTYMTGEGSMYTKLFARETGINLIFGSHYATEFPGITALGERVAGEFGLPWEAILEDLSLR